MKRPLTPEDARARAEDICAAAEHCTFEVRTRLQRMGLDDRETEKIIKGLADARFLDDRRFADAYARNQLLYAGWGTGKIRIGLMQKRVERGVIAEALESLDVAEYRQVLSDLLANRVRTASIDLSDPRQREKVIRYAVGRGFELSLIIELLRGMR